MIAQLTRRDGERGQVLAIFALALVAIIAATGLVLDGGSVVVQRRDQQNVADSAAMAGAYAYLMSGSTTTAQSAAQGAAAANGYTNGSGGVIVTTSTGVGSNGATQVTVTVTKPHRNYFASVLGMSSWDVSTAATSEAGAPNAAIGALPLIFNTKGFPHGRGPANETAFDLPGSGNEDVPQTATSFNWTVFCMANGSGHGGCNADSNTVRNLIENKNERDKVVKLTDNIAPLNSGNHTTLFSSLATHIGSEFPIAVVDDAGAFKGWAMFHLTGSVGGSTKQIRGYFVDPVQSTSLYIAPGGGNGTSQFGAYSVALID